MLLRLLPMQFLRSNTMGAFGIIKFIGAWFCIVGAVVVLILDRGASGLALPLSVLSIAFAQAPSAG